MITELLLAYRQVREARRRERELATLEATPLNYTILRDLINSARYDVVVHVKMRDGTELDIRRADAFDKLQQRRSAELAGTY